MEKKEGNPDGSKFKGKVLSRDDELPFEGNFIWKLKDSGSSACGLDHCNCCDVDVTINAKKLQEHYTSQPN